ncbi:Membrane protein involved in the export of O-antigen and teichoic acid [Catalinimonas alkaloidigena]|uniref:Membrane protein involved in the export of O-antigen and teichoic acid n=1 Tax=Catalinimonas alkaloidigena TaxID=1075417 RepID=A0A1G9H4A8_9BACT|nr:oligosaccharide flippase family protein [Catalinimonas alkaloidigena]SDL07303.1 Membrane protein involved in the export of O-antigen and teichoic acid [Catalinimonas alkaloidigena]
MRTYASVSSYWFTSGTYMLLQQVASLFFGFGGFYLLVRTLTKEEFGTWTLFYTIAAFVELARNGLVQNAQIKFTAMLKGEGGYGRVMTASLVLNVLFTVLVCGLLYLTAPVIDRWTGAPQLSIMFLYFTLTVVASIPISQCNYAQQSNLDLRGVFFSNFTRLVTFFVVIVVAVVSELEISLWQLVIAQGICTGLGSVVAVLISRKYLRFSRHIDWPLMLRLFHYGKFSFGTNVGSMLSGIVTQVLLSSLLSPVAVGLFGIAFRVNTLVEVPIVTLATVLFPKSAKRAEEEGLPAVKYLYERSVACLLAFCLPALLLVEFFAEPIVTLIAGSEYREAAPLLRISILLILLVPFSRQFGVVIDSIGKPDLNFYLLIGRTALTIALSYGLINTSGIPGALWGTLLAMAVNVVVVLFILRKEMRVRLKNIVYYFKQFYRKDVWSMTHQVFGMVFKQAA